MITPFLALSYYSFYGPSLNFLNQSALTSWLTGFFLPHLSVTESSLINSLNPLGRYLFMISFLVFLIGAGQIYYAKFMKKGSVSGGLYTYVRHPQYTMFTLMGLGLLLVWPRFIILLIYILMIFIYYFLAKNEEKECAEKYPGYEEYMKYTSMFIPGDNYLLKWLPTLSKFGRNRIIAILGLYVIVCSLFVLLAMGVRNYSIRNTAMVIDQNSVTVSVAQIEKENIEKTLRSILANDSIKSRLGDYEKYNWLNYLVPASWFLADLPLEPYREGMEGHVMPNPDKTGIYHLLFTRAITHGNVVGLSILKRTYRRVPVLVVKIDLGTNEIMETFDPPQHVVWGDIPTPLF